MRSFHSFSAEFEADLKALIRAAVLECLAASVPSKTDTDRERGEWFELSTGHGFRLDLVDILIPLRPATAGESAYWNPMVQLRTGQCFDISDDDFQRIRARLGQSDENLTASTPGKTHTVREPGEWIPFNVNHNIRMTLTDHGREALVKHWQFTYPDRARAEQACDTCHPGWRGGPTVMQLWVAMEIFGPGTSLGAENLFETAIEFQIDPYTTPPALTDSTTGNQSDPPNLKDFSGAPGNRIGVFDYNSLVECLTQNWEIVFPREQPTDAQDMIQKMTATIQSLRRQKEEFQRRLDNADTYKP